MALTAAALVLFALPAASQTVSLYKGSIAIGFGDPANYPGGSRVQPQNPIGPVPDLANNGVPACANDNPFLPATIASIPMIGFAEQGAGTPASVKFGGYAPIDIAGASGGGQATITVADCAVVFPPWLANNALRSRAQLGAQVWPGNALNTAQTAATGPPGGTLAVGGGNTAAASVLLTSTFYSNGRSGMQLLTPGPNQFGGGVPVNGGGAVKLGVNTNMENLTGAPLSTFGVRQYIEGLLPTGPAAYGTDATDPGLNAGFQGTNPFTWLLRTPGPGTTMMNPFTEFSLTPNLGWPQGSIVTAGGGVPITTMGDFFGVFQKWTTGRVVHTDMGGNYFTDRTATGHDWTAGEFATNNTPACCGTTRKLQLVSPWSASIRRRLTGPFAGIFVNFPVDFGFGGVAILTLDLQPAPEPGSTAMIAIGAAGLAGMGALRRRRA
jgi:hypothetical protein